MVKYSFIIPAYNAESYIKTTIESVLSASNSETEIIVINDGSSDGTADILNNYTDRIVAVTQENKGVSSARNRGIDNAHGDYLIFCDGDDLCKDNLIGTLSHYIDSQRDMYLWGFEDFNTSSNTYVTKQSSFGVTKSDGVNALQSILLQNIRTRLGAFAVKRSLLEEHGIRFTDGLPIAEDIEFIYKCLANAKIVEYIDDVLFTYVKHEGSSMYSYNMDRFKAPRVMKSLAEYVHEGFDLDKYSEVCDLLSKGAYLLHTMYAFDSCISYIKDKKTLKEFIARYYRDYSDIEIDLKKIRKDITRFLPVYSDGRYKLLLLSRKLYVYIMYYRNNG